MSDDFIIDGNKIEGVKITKIQIDSTTMRDHGYLKDMIKDLNKHMQDVDKERQAYWYQKSMESLYGHRRPKDEIIKDAEVIEIRKEPRLTSSNRGGPE